MLHIDLLIFTLSRNHCLPYVVLLCVSYVHTELIWPHLQMKMIDLSCIFHNSKQIPLKCLWPHCRDVLTQTSAWLLFQWCRSQKSKSLATLAYCHQYYHLKNSVPNYSDGLSTLKHLQPIHSAPARHLTRTRRTVSTLFKPSHFYNGFKIILDDFMCCCCLLIYCSAARQWDGSTSVLQL